MRTLRIAALTALALIASTAFGQYPDRPVRLLVPFAAGGPSDTAARILGRALSKSIGQQVVVENRPGANGAVAAQAVLAAAPDGYTLLWGVGSMVALPLLLKTPPFESFAALAPISAVGQFAFCMYVHPSVPAGSVERFVSHARANPDKLNYATSTLGEYLAASQFMKATGVTMVRVPYKGSAQAMPDLVSGRVQVTFGPIAAGLAHAKDGKLQMPACLARKRSAAAPDVPTMAEAGLPGVSVPTWQAVFGPTRTPPAVVEQLARQIARALQDPEALAQFEAQNFDAAASTRKRSPRSCAPTSSAGNSSSATTASRPSEPGRERRRCAGRSGRAADRNDRRQLDDPGLVRCGRTAHPRSAGRRTPPRG